MISYTVLNPGLLQKMSKKSVTSTETFIFTSNLSSTYTKMLPPLHQNIPHEIIVNYYDYFVVWSKRVDERRI